MIAMMRQFLLVVARRVEAAFHFQIQQPQGPLRRRFLALLFRFRLEME
jgi:hypothetical protein